MATILFSNNATSNLAGAISNVATTAQLTAGSGVLFPTPGPNQFFKLTFIDAATGLLREIVSVTAISGDQITIVRAQEGTNARAWLAGDLAVNMWTAGSAAAMAQQANLFSAFCVDSGSANSIIITVPNNPASLAALVGVPLVIGKSNFANTGPVTVTANGSASVALKTINGQALVGGELSAGSVFTIAYDGFEFQMQSNVNSVVGGGTGRTGGLTAHGLLVGEGTAPINILSPGVAGQVLVSGGPSADPAFGSIGVAGGGTGQTSLTAHALLVGENQNPIATVSPSSTAGEPLLSNGSNSDPSFGQLNLAGGGITGVLGVANGGTGDNFLGPHVVLIGQGGSAIQGAAPSTSGQPLCSNGPSSDPTFQAVNLGGAGVSGVLGVNSGGTGHSGLNNQSLLVGAGSAAVNFIYLSSNGNGAGVSAVYEFDGNPNGALSGSAATGTTPPDMCWDYLDAILWVSLGGTSWKPLGGSGGGAFENMNVYQIISGTQQVSVNGLPYTSTGATSFPRPPSGTCKLRMWGGTGGGGGCFGANSAGSGAGGAGYVESILTGLTGPTTVTVGLAGIGGDTSPAQGGSGGDSAFGGVIAGGSQGGFPDAGGIASTGGAGGTGINAILIIPGSNGGTANLIAGAMIAGLGGSAYGSPTAPPEIGEVAAVGRPGLFPGGGGGGGINGAPGGFGTNGMVIIEY